jgi:Trypsin
MKRALLPLLILATSAASAQIPTEVNKQNFTCASSHSLDRLTRQPAPADCRRFVDRPQEFGVRVTGGDAAPDERYTAAIFFVNQNGERDICTGVLLDARHVLTAGHCGCGATDSYRITFKQFAGQSDRTEEIRLERGPILFDPMTCIRGVAPGRDLALLRLETERVKNANEFGYPAFAFAADFAGKMQPGMRLKVVGYGETETGGLASRMKAMIPVLTADCVARPYNLSCAPFQEMILADDTGLNIPRDTCGGDSGGPVFVETPVRLPACTGNLVERIPFENQAEKVVVTQNVLVAITSREAPFTHPLRGQHCGGGGIYTLIGRQPIYAWFRENNVRPQRCAG